MKRKNYYLFIFCAIVVGLSFLMDLELSMSEEKLIQAVMITLIFAAMYFLGLPRTKEESEAQRIRFGKKKSSKTTDTNRPVVSTAMKVFFVLCWIAALYIVLGGSKV